MHFTLPLVSVLVLAITMMFLLGLEVPLTDALAAMKNYQLMAKALVANIVLLPILAILFTTLAHLPEDITIGVLLMAAAPGAVAIPRMTTIAKGNLAVAVGLMTVLQLASVLITPFTLHFILPSDAAVKVHILSSVVSLVVLLQLPLAVGIFVKHRAASFAAVIAKPVQLLFALSAIATLVLLIVPHLDVVGKVFGGGALAIMLLLVIVAWPIGWVLGGPDVGVRKPLAFGTSSRRFGLCLVIAIQNFPQTGVAAAVFSYFLIQTVANLVFAKYLGRAPKPG